MTKDEQLFDVLFRHQIYLEMFKLGLAKQFMSILKQMYKELSPILIDLPSLDQLSKAQLAALMQAVKAVTLGAFKPYNDDLIQNLKEFSSADNLIVLAIFKLVTGSEPEKQSDDSLWSFLSNDPSPASGLLLQQQINSFINVSTTAIISTLSKGYANAWTAQEAMQVIAGSSKGQFNDGLFARFLNQNEALTNTQVQQVSQNVLSSIAMNDFDEYIWVSILDNRTTEICIKRAGNIYKYGEGPLPPAHFQCRSHTVPFDGSADHPETYAESIARQPEGFKNDVLGALLNNRATKALTLEQFVGKMNLILTGE